SATAVATFTGRVVSASVLTLAEGVMKSLPSTSTNLVALAVAAGALTVAVATAGFFPGDGPAPNHPQPAKDAPALRVIPLNARADPKADPNLGPVAWKETKPLNLPGWLGGSVAYSPDGKTFFVGGTSGFVRAYDSATMKQLWEYQEPTNFAAVAAAP